MQWTDDLALGVPTIDDQNRNFIELANKIGDLESGKATKGEMRSIVSGLCCYADFHFRDEEDEMRRSGYLFLNDHILTHRSASDKLHVFLEHDADTADLYRVLSIFLKKWLIEHIKNHDRVYGQWLEDEDRKQACVE